MELQVCPLRGINVVLKSPVTCTYTWLSVSDLFPHVPTLSILVMLSALFLVYLYSGSVVSAGRGTFSSIIEIFLCSRYDTILEAQQKSEISSAIVFIKTMVSFTDVSLFSENRMSSIALFCLSLMPFRLLLLLLHFVLSVLCRQVEYIP